MKTLLACLVLIAIASCGIAGDIERSDEELKKITEFYRPVIDALKRYRDTNGSYPKNLSQLFLDFNSESSDFGYVRTENDKYGGYQLMVGNIRQFTMVGARKYIMFIYRPNETYPRRKFEKPLKRVNDWALIKYSRTYGADNPITGDGV